ncbi:MAG: hypothetical protein JWM56_799 [Candidatus Peribacteria bacterium]|nr:hypothetical protein [Candidatus Peribacteria bacterium]
MNPISEIDETNLEARLTFHRRVTDKLIHPAFKEPRFDEAKQLISNLLHEKQPTDISPVQFTAVNTDAQSLYLATEPEKK